MPTINMEEGITADYRVAAGKLTVTMKTTAPFRYKAAFTGMSQMNFHEVPGNRDTGSWAFEPSIPEPRVAQVQKAAAEGGKFHTTVSLEGVYPAVGLLRDTFYGKILAPAIHFHISWGEDLWVFLIRSPWFPLRVEVETTERDRT